MEFIELQEQSRTYNGSWEACSTNITWHVCDLPADLTEIVKGSKAETLKEQAIDSDLSDQLEQNTIDRNAVNLLLQLVPVSYAHYGWDCLPDPNNPSKEVLFPGITWLQLSRINIIEKNDGQYQINARYDDIRRIDFCTAKFNTNRSRRRITHSLKKDCDIPISYDYTNTAWQKNTDVWAQSFGAPTNPLILGETDGGIEGDEIYTSDLELVVGGWLRASEVYGCQEDSLMNCTMTREPFIIAGPFLCFDEGEVLFTHVTTPETDMCIIEVPLGSNELPNVSQEVVPGQIDDCRTTLSSTKAIIDLNSLNKMVYVQWHFLIQKNPGQVGEGAEGSYSIDDNLPLQGGVWGWHGIDYRYTQVADAGDLHHSPQYRKIHAKYKRRHWRTLKLPCTRDD